MNWGTKLVIGMALFMGFIIFLGIKMIRSKDDALVDNDYYEKGVHYDEDYRKKENVKKEHAEPLMTTTEGQLELIFKKPAEGSLLLIRTADKKLDRELRLKTGEKNQFLVPLRQMASGLWKVRINWASEGKYYLYEKEVMLP